MNKQIVYPQTTGTGTGNAWWPRLSPDGRYIAFGTKQVWIAELPGREFLLGPDPAWRDPTDPRLNLRWYILGWYDADTLYYDRGTFVDEQIVISELWSYTASTGETRKLQDLPLNLGGLGCRNGHWAVSIPGDSLWLDGVRQPVYRGWSLEIDGPDVVTAFYTGPQMYHDGVYVGSVPGMTQEGGAMVREGVFTARQNGRDVCWTTKGSGLVDVTHPPQQSYGSTLPVYCHGWFFQGLEHIGPDDRSYLQAWEAGSPFVYMSERPRGSKGYLDVVHVGNTFVTVTLHDGVTAVVEWVKAEVSGMPFINSRGDVAHGVGGGYCNRNNEQVAFGGVLGWWDDDTIAFCNGNDNWLVSLYHVPTKTIERLDDKYGGPAGGMGANLGFASNNKQAAWWFGTNEPGKAGLWSTVGLRAEVAGLMGMGLDGAIGYKPEYQSMGPTKVREIDGTEWQISAGSTEALCLLGPGKAVWCEGLLPQTVGLPPLAIAPGQH